MSRSWRRWCMRISTGLALATLVAVASPSPTLANRSHTVRQGQTLSAIARRYGVSVHGIRSANRLREGDMLRPGDVLEIPERGVIYVRPGDTLSEIARDHGVSVRELMRLNRMREGDGLRAGQRLVLPGHEPAERREQAARRWGEPDHPGVATLVRYAPRRRSRVRLVDHRGRVRPVALRRMVPIMRSRRNDRSRRPHWRLVQNLARVSDHFGGRPIVVVSGYRPARGYTRESSRHTRGHAIDFSIAGVPNTALRDYLRTLSKVGVGYYPRSSFVHLDVRDRDAYWVDWSRPGQRPQYRGAGSGPPPSEGGDPLDMLEREQDEALDRVDGEAEDVSPEGEDTSAERTEAPGEA